MTENAHPLLKGFVRLSGSVAEVANKLGPLAGLEGTWHGTDGWNMIAVPSQNHGTAGFTLLVQNYSETITFTAIGAPVPNRGGATEQFITGLTYELTVTDNTTQGILHIENGMWLNMADVQIQPDGPVKAAAPMPFTIARMASIPHGDVVMALGNATTTSGGFSIPDINALPVELGRPDLGYLDPYKIIQQFPQFSARNPNLMLQKAIQNQKIGNVTTIQVDTNNQGGNISNIPFIHEHVNASRFFSTFWIEDVSMNGVNFKQLQYSQQADLDFLPKFHAPGLIMWPHVNVNTLRKQ
ncbi:heme-binding protein [Mucilaginibacter xinganensis]|uniref:Uncharacterized protein n=1 Tax=Mucilaginibacter xinganensis TaxID=1234841 RepID=A0A223NRQ7_9SPHI|nr:heme-binding protein [Mucilaginibacter xinganensis]ASU32338.1 hypothetical protein MuYL_0435 [Mucilaginibacter xinganensis]